MKKRKTEQSVTAETAVLPTTAAAEEKVNEKTRLKFQRKKKLTKSG